MEKLDEYLTIRDAAEFLGVSTNTLRNWGRDGNVRWTAGPPYLAGVIAFRQLSIF